MVTDPGDVPSWPVVPWFVFGPAERLCKAPDVLYVTDKNQFSAVLNISIVRFESLLGDLTLDKLILTEAAKDEARYANHSVVGLQP